MSQKGYRAMKDALEITRIVLQSTHFDSTPNAETANCIADFIETLSARLEPIVETDD